MPGTALCHLDSLARRPAVGGSAGHGARGFTMIELIVVMLMMSILSVAAIPSLASLGTQKHSAAARQVVRDLTYARERAMATNAKSWFVVSVSGGSYSVLAESNTSPGRAGATTINDPATGGLFVVRPGMGTFTGVAITACAFGGGSEVGFDRLGRPLLTSGALLTTTGTITVTGGHIASLSAQTGRATYVAGAN